MHDKTKNLIDHLWYCLPADSKEQIETRMKKRVGRPVTNVGTLISLTRKHEAELGWTMPHVKRGRPGDTKHRYLRVSTDGSGTMIFDNEVNHQRLEDGMYGDSSYTATLMRNESAAIRGASQLISSAKDREYLLGYAEDCEAISKKAARVAKVLKVKEAA